MRAIICGGGTVGHISPAVAIAEEILKNDKESEILFIGRDRGEENNLIINRGFNLLTIEIAGLNRKNILKSIKVPYLVLKSYFKAKKIIKQFKPDIVIGTGGYVCLPVIKAASSLKVKCVLHESNAVAGLSTKMLYKNCSLLFLNIPINELRFEKDNKTLRVGTPVLNDFKNITREKARGTLGIKGSDIVILSFGGSGGAVSINECIVDLSKKLPEYKKRIVHIHATGRKYYKEIKDRIKASNTRYELRLMPYIDDMPTYMRAADIVIARAGAITIAELATIGVASILIPSPNVTDNHQYKNAEALSKANAIVMIEEAELSGSRLKKEIQALISSARVMHKLIRNIKNFSSENSAKKIYNEIVKIIS